jgi:DNA-binding Lrp family transcriptional regulator
MLPAPVRYDQYLPDKAKLLYAEITAIMDFRGTAKQDINYYSRLLDLSTDRVRKLLRLLLESGYLERFKLDKINYLRIPTKEIVIKRETDTGDKKQKQTITDAMEIISTWNKLFKSVLLKPLVRTDYLTDQVTQRLKQFSKEDILTAMKNRHDFVANSAWHNKPENLSHMCNIQHVIGSDEELEKNLSMVRVIRSDDMAKTTKPFNANEDTKTILE